MKNLIIISFLLLFASHGFGQSRKDKKILSSSFVGSDSISIQISYTEIPNCIEAEYGYVLIFIKNDSVHVNHRFPKTHKIESFSVYNKLAFGNVIDFEKTGKDTNACGGYVGGNGVEIKLRINDSKTEFYYCKDTWDGISKLISKIKN